MHRGGQAASSEEEDAEAMTSGRIERAGEKRRLHQNEFTKKKKGIEGWVSHLSFPMQLKCLLFRHGETESKGKERERDRDLGVSCCLRLFVLVHERSR